MDLKATTPSACACYYYPEALTNLALYCFFFYGFICRLRKWLEQFATGDKNVSISVSLGQAPQAQAVRIRNDETTISQMQGVLIK